MIVLGLLGLGAFLMMKKKGASMPGTTWESPEGKGWGAIQEELYGWFPHGDQASEAEKREFMDAALPKSVTMSDWQKFANGSPLGGGYTQQDKMLLEDTLT